MSVWAFNRMLKCHISSLFFTTVVLISMQAQVFSPQQKGAEMFMAICFTCF